MSRICRYKEIIHNFFENRSCIKNINQNNYNYIQQKSNEFTHINAIILLSCLNKKYKKKKNRFHGYYAAIGTDLMWYILQLHEQNIELDYNFIFQLMVTIYSSVVENIFKIEKKTKIEGLNYICISYLNKCMYQLKLYKIVNIEEQLNNYHILCKFTLVIAWLLGAGDTNSINLLEKTGIYLGNIAKISNDFINFNKNINFSYVKEFGIKDSFIKYMDNKTMLIENLMILGIFTKTIKELLDYMEKDMNIYLEQGIN